MGGEAERPTEYVALFRGVNVGRYGRVAMADIRAAAREAGLRAALTVGASGNLVFEANEPDAENIRADLEAAVFRRTGLALLTFVLTVDELRAVLSEDPLAGEARDPSRLVTVVPGAATDLAKLTRLLAANWLPDTLAVGSRAAYLWLPEGTAGRPLAQAVERAMGGRMTLRTRSSLERIAARLKPAPDV